MLLISPCYNAGGENVYCSEVEAIISAHPQVLQAAVFGMPNIIMGEVVHAAVVLRQPLTTPVSPQDITSWCQTQLALYKCPTVVHIVDELPTTGSGKVAKNVIRAMFGKGGAAAAVATAAVSPVASTALTLPVAATTPAAGAGDSSGVQKLVEAVAAQPHSISVVDSTEEGFCLDPTLCYVLVIEDWTYAVSKVTIPMRRLL